jgi:hypothetical protein
VRNEEECACSAPNCCDTEQRSVSQWQIIKEMPGSVASGTPIYSLIVATIGRPPNCLKVFPYVHNYSLQK